MASGTVPRDCLNVVLLGAFCAFALVALLVLVIIPQPTVVARAASAGDWVTNPDGSRVCRLTRDLFRGMTASRDICSDWQGTPPTQGQTVPWLRARAGGGTQINVEGRWRP